MSFPVLLDACVLIPMPTADLMLRLAEAKQFRPLWSEEILDETERNLISGLGLPPEKARSRVTTMRTYFPDAMVRNYEPLTNAMTNDPKDRHVLAAAVRSGAELIVTFNKKDFPSESVAPYDLDVRNPDDFLLDQLDLSPESVTTAVHNLLHDAHHPPMTMDAYVEKLTGCGMPLFARSLALELSRDRQRRPSASK
ncbi:PIN domain-containing protein [Curtobacterium sp. S6]|uniref:PIN domain-containing protein n=1 Tax=Curtobacterium sp. S6 TaxID=1479623 RepID=UPI00055AC4E9|nr:PIN domain-containing protein [Curtobacterium sp. S6]